MSEYYQPKEPWGIAVKESAGNPTPVTISTWLPDNMPGMISVSVPSYYKEQYLWQFAITGLGFPREEHYLPGFDPYDRTDENWERVREAAVDAAVAQLQEKIAQLQGAVEALKAIR